VHVVAEFAPSDAVGRVLPGQAARVRLSGFSWTEFGMLDAVVDQVASEPRDGTIRVELRLASTRAPAIPVQHGLPGSVEVEIERVAPWVLVLRDVGARVAQSTPSASTSAPASSPSPAPAAGTGANARSR
jgi:membrane fusion protein (multidrug efflux system)